MGGEGSKQSAGRQVFASTMNHPKLANAKVIKPDNENESPYL